MELFIVFLIQFGFGVVYTVFGVSYLNSIDQLELYLGKPSKLVTWPAVAIRRAFNSEDK